jgi:RNA polymerase sigma factor (sigma-70 family)
MRIAASRQLRALFDGGTVAGMPDGLLLERFVAQGDGRAFEAILTRHGPMVIGVCRRVLAEPSDVEDAFQATFLILVRKARTLRDGSRLGPWLFGVAHRVAIRARAQEGRRRICEREQKRAGAPDTEPGGDAERRELLAVLDVEIARLPENYRGAVVLCDLEGQSYEQAARQLGCPLGTLKSRLSAARDRLRRRLSRRGLAPLALGAAIAGGRATAEVPKALAEQTLAAALTGSALAAADTLSVSMPVSTLVRGVLTTMFLTRLKTISLFVLVLATSAAGLGVLAQPPGGTAEDEQINRLERLVQDLKERRDLIRRFKHDQDRTVTELEKLGGKVERGVVSVNLVATKVTDHDLSALSIFPNLQSIHLHHTNIGDAGLANISRLRSLTTLDLFDTRVTDAGLYHLSEWMPHLEVLELSDTRVTDRGLPALNGLKHLRRLDLRKTGVTEEGIRELRRALPGTEILH